MFIFIKFALKNLDFNSFIFHTKKKAAMLRKMRKHFLRGRRKFPYKCNTNVSRDYTLFTFLDYKKAATLH
jgi:hypothetical protein